MNLTRKHNYQSIVMAAVMIMGLSNFLFAWGWIARDAGRQADESPSIYLGDYLDISYDLNADAWGATYKEIGWGPVNSVGGLTWSAMEWVDEAGDGTGNNEGVRLRIQASATGTMYYSAWVGWDNGGGDDDAAGGDNGRYYNGSSTWNEGFDAYSSSSFTINALNNPSWTMVESNAGDPGGSIDLSWSQDAQTHNVLIARATVPASLNAWSPSQGTGYSAGSTDGDITIVQGSQAGTSYTDSGLSDATTYHYRIFSENYSYYSSGTASDSETTGTPLNIEPPEIPQDIKLTAYPNPFNPATRIDYELTQQEQVLLQVFNLQGKLICTLVDHKQIPGQHSANWAAQNNAAGIYIIRLSAGNSRSSNKVILLK